MPDPECAAGRLLGRWWVGWFQPQHQHLVPIDNLCEALEAEGFTVVASRDPLRSAGAPAGGMEPPSLALVDTSDDGLGFPRNEVTGATDLCREASGLAVADVGDGERAYVSCFQDGEVYVIDPRGGVEVEDIATIGRGPFSVVASPTRRRLYVSNFFENTVAVVDLTPGAPTA